MGHLRDKAADTARMIETGRTLKSALAASANLALVDYIGAGPVFATPSRLDHKVPVGVDGPAAQVAASVVPAVAIGGLKADHVARAFSPGAQGVAVVSAYPASRTQGLPPAPSGTGATP
ncbi:thiamine phosphate synthase [Roseovarius atlanticus]|uniref:thiamine phosphate synthase n=1 Tax=Roseovarius atlanticus TaxID=1641875 RepID=UPI0028F6D6B6|nr:thiamine phosphate synthase [Roseovarius atlanticus]